MKELIDRLRDTITLKPTKKGLLSVIIPIYGTFGTERLTITIESLKNQEDVDLEIIVCEQGPEPSLKDTLDDSVKYVFNKYHSNVDLSESSNGKIRNIAAIHAEGEFIFTCDADIVFLDNHFFRNSLSIMEADSSSFLCHPPVKRLPIGDFEEFYSRVEKLGLQDALNSLHITNGGMVISIDGTERERFIKRKMKDIFCEHLTCFPEDHQKYVENIDYYRGKEALLFYPDIHPGSSIFRYEHFELLGGYHSKFFQWGTEDLDLQNKGEAILNKKQFPKGDEYHLMHLDHDRSPYFREEHLKKNDKNLYERVWYMEEAIPEDQKVWRDLLKNKDQFFCKNI